MNLLLIISLLVSLAILCTAVAVRHWLEWTRVSLAAYVDATEAERHQRQRNRPQAKQVMESLFGRLAYTERLQHHLSLADIKMTATEFLTFRIAGSLGLGLIVGIATGMILAALVAGALVWFAFGFHVRRKRDKRLKLFNAQLGDVLNLLVTSLRAGFGLTQALASVSTEMPSPAADEFDRVLKETMLGYSLHEALDRLVERIGSEDLELVATSIHIQAEVGGNLAEVLENIAGTIRARIELDQKIRSLTSEQRYSGTMLAGLPFLLAAVISVINPGYMMELIQPGWPRLIPVAVAIMSISGYLLMRRMMSVDY
ncbi:MAG: type II secretion system F family protein [Caldilineales bacterium]|nr:type II secretion system F family protein [Caldilineales bacterium]